MTRSSNLAPRGLGANDNEIVGGDSKANNKNSSKSKKLTNIKSGI